MGLLLQMLGLLMVIISLVLGVISIVQSKSTTLPVVLLVIGILLIQFGRHFNK